MPPLNLEDDQYTALPPAFSSMIWCLRSGYTPFAIM